MVFAHNYILNVSTQLKISIKQLSNIFKFDKGYKLVIYIPFVTNSIAETAYNIPLLFQLHLR